MNLSPLSLESLLSRPQFKPFLWVLSLFFGMGVKIKNSLYDFGFLKSKKCRAFVVSIGNVEVGGTGKTPFTEFLAKEILTFTRVAILSRGYKGLAEKKREPVVVSYGNGPVVTPTEGGDEPYLLAKNVPDAIVIAGRNRYKAAQIAEKLGAKVVILDDGMQHRRLHRDFEIVLLNRKERYFLPRGFLRDDWKRVEKADLVVSNGELEEKITTEISLENVKIGAFCGIARPERFLKTLRDLKGEVRASYFLRDHKKIGREELMRFATKSKELGAERIVCTQKDFIKLEAIGELPLPLSYVRKEVMLNKNRKLFMEAIENIKRGCRQ